MQKLYVPKWETAAGTCGKKSLRLKVGSWVVGRVYQDGSDLTGLAGEPNFIDISLPFPLR
jgi:hypothetical protein